MAKSLKHLTKEQRAERAARIFVTRQARRFPGNTSGIESTEIIHHSVDAKASTHYTVVVRYKDGLNWDTVRVTVYANDKTRARWSW